MPEPRARGYTAAMRTMHWLTVALLLFAYPLAWSIDDAASAAEAARLVMLHRSFGVLLLLITLVRLAWRRRTHIPALPPELPSWQVSAARANTVMLYALLLAQPVLGLTASWLHGDHVVIFGMARVPALLPPDRPLGRLLFWLHGRVALLLLAVIGLHVAAALHHHFVRRDDVLSGMLASRAPRPAAEPERTESPR